MNKERALANSGTIEVSGRCALGASTAFNLYINHRPTHLYKCIFKMASKLSRVSVLVKQLVKVTLSLSLSLTLVPLHLHVEHCDAH